jgi:hypothetical protein
MNNPGELYLALPALAMALSVSEPEAAAMLRSGAPTTDASTREPSRPVCPPHPP